MEDLAYKSLLERIVDDTFDDSIILDIDCDEGKVEAHVIMEIDCDVE